VNNSKFLFLTAIIVLVAIGLSLGSVVSEEKNDEYLSVKYDIVDSHGYSEATAPRTMSITLPSASPMGSSEEARNKTLSMVLASVLMFGALIGAMAYIFVKNRKNGFSPENDVVDAVVARLAVAGLMSIVAIYGLMMVLSDDASATITPIGSNVNASKLLENQAEVTIAVNPYNPDNLIAASNDATAGKTNDMTWYTLDGGVTWTASPIPNTTYGTPATDRWARGDPTVVFDRSGNAYYAHLSEDTSKEGVSVAKSTDGGATWTAVEVPTSGTNNDKEFLAVGPDPTDPSKDRIYVGYQNNGVQYVNASGDGVTWSAAVQVSDSGNNGINCQLAVDDNGVVYMCWQETGGAAGYSDVLFDKSTDGGATWGTDTVAYSGNINPFNDPFPPAGTKYTIPAAPDRGVGAYLAMECDRSGGPNTGNIYILILDQGDLDGDPDSGNATDHHDTDVFVIRSGNGGTSWSGPVRVNDDATNYSQFVPWLDVDQSSGMIAVGWYDCRNDDGSGPNADDLDGTENNDVQYYMSVSLDGGVSFEPNVRVSDGVSSEYGPSNWDPGYANLDWGEYSGIAVYRNSVYACWTDNSNSTGDNPAFPVPPGDGSLDVYVQKLYVGTQLREVENFAGQQAAVDPPDTIGDVGPSVYIQMVNDPGGSRFEIYDKSGNVLQASTLTDSLVTAAPFNSGHGDPVVIYDHLADRWLISEFAPKGGGSPYQLMMYVSQTSDPTDDLWYAYYIETDTFPDYFKIALWDNGDYSAYFIGVNNNAWPWDDMSIKCKVYAVDRDAMLAGTGAYVNGVSTGEIDYIEMITDRRPNWSRNHMMPADIDGPRAPSGSPGIFVWQVDDEITNPGGNDPTKDFLEVWEFVPDFATPANSTFTKAYTIDIADFDGALNVDNRDTIPQKGTAAKIDALPYYMYWRLQYRNFGSYETLVSNFTVDVDQTDHAGIRWFELRNTGSGWTLYQEGTIAPDTAHRWMASIAMDGEGNMAIGYSISDETMYPSIRIMGRLADDPLGTMPRGEYTVFDGLGFQDHTERWGDYSAMSVDPLDDKTFWYTTEYIDATGVWDTQIAAFSFQESEQTVNGTASGNIMVLRRNALDPTKVEIEIDGSVSPSNVFEYSLLDTLTINGLGGDDSLTIDFDNGDPIPSGGLSYNGGTNGAGGDSLSLTNGSFGTTTYDFTNSSSGTIALDGSLVSYTGLEPITSTITATTVVLNYSTAAETLTVADSGTAGQTRVTSTSGETVTFTNPSGSLTINAGNTGGDTVDFNGTGSGFSATLTIDGQGGSDSLNVNGTGGADTVTMTKTSITVNGLPIIYQSFSTFSITTGAGDDTVVILGTPSGTQTTVDTWQGAQDSMYVGVNAGSENTGAGTLANIDGDLLLLDSGGVCKEVWIDNSSDGASRSWTVDSPAVNRGRVTVTGISGRITYDSGDCEGIHLVGGGGDDQFSVDLTGGNPSDPLPYDDLNLHGGGEAAGDSLSLAGPPVTSMTYDYTNAYDGTITFDDFTLHNDLIRYFNLEPISSTITATTVTLNYSTTGETVTVDDSGTEEQTVVTSTAGETTTFTNPTGTLVINAGDTGDDGIIVNGLGSSFTANISLNGGSGDDSITLYDTPTTGTMTVNGESDDDSLTVDFSVGSPIPSGGVTYHGGSESTIGDYLMLQGGSCTAERYTVTGAGSGTIDLDGSVITFDGLEPIYDTVAAVQLDILLTAAGETIDILDGFGIGSFTTTEVSGSTFESIEFANKTTVTVNGFDGADEFIVDNPNNADGLTTLKLYGNELTGGSLNADDNSNDKFRMRKTSVALSSIDIFGQGGDDVLVHIWSPDGANLDNLLCPSMNFDGGPGTADEITLQDSLSITGDTVTLTSTTLTGPFGNTVAVLTYSGTELFFIETSSMADTIDILSTNIGTNYFITGDGGDDTFTVGNETVDFNSTFDGSLDSILGDVTISPEFNGSSGVNTFNVDDSGTAGLNGPRFTNHLGYVFQAPTTTLTGFAPATIAYFHDDYDSGTFNGTQNSLDYLNVLTSTGTDTINVDDTTATNTTTIDTYTGDDSSTVIIVGDTLSGNNLLKGNTGNDRFVLNITNDLGASSVFPLTGLQIEGNDPSATLPGDGLEIDDGVGGGGGARILTFTYLTPVGGNVDITGFAVPINVRTMETIGYDGDSGDNDQVTVVGTNNDDELFVTSLGPDSADVTIDDGVAGGSQGPDLSFTGLHPTSGLTIDGDDPAFFTDPGDWLTYDGSGTLTISSPGAGKIDGVGVLDVNFREIEFLDASGDFYVIIDADSLGAGGNDDGNADIFKVYRADGGWLWRLDINTILIINIVWDSVDNLTVNGSTDDDTMICDFGDGNPIPPNGIVFNADGEQTTGDSIILQSGAVADIIYTFFNATDGTIEIDSLLITYYGLSPIYDNLDASNRVFNFPATPDIIWIYRLSATVNRIESDSSSELVEFLSPTLTMTVNMGTGDDILTIGDDDPTLVPGFADDFTAALTINGDDGWDTINVMGPVGTPVLPLTSIAFNVQLANLHQPMYSPAITGTCLIVNVWYPGLIQNAIDIAHPTDGCLITVYPATYPENLTNWKPDIRLRSAAGAESTFITAPSGIILDIMTGTSGFILGGSHDTGFTLMSTGAVEKGLTGIDLVDLTVTDNSFKGPGMDFGIHITGITSTGINSFIQKNTFYECGTAIAIYNGNGATKLTITRNCAFDSLEHAILLGEDGSGDMKFIVITENTLSKSGIGLKIEAGPHILADYFVVKFNNFMGNDIGLLNETTLLVTAKKNFWNSPEGPYAEDNPNGIPNPVTGYGDGDPIQDYVIADPWLTIIHHPSVCDLTITLSPGWNLISITVKLDSLGGDYTASTFAAEMSSHIGEQIIKYIVRWDSGTGHFVEYVVDTDVGTDFSIEYGEAYYLYSISPFESEFHIVGDCPVYETVDLTECWNLIGWMSMDSMDVGDFAEMIDHHAGYLTVQAIVKYDDSYSQGENQYILWCPGMDDDLFEMAPGEAYWVFVANDLIELPYP